MLVAEAVGRAIARHGVSHVFGVVGSGNFHVTNALVEGGARFVAARHEGGAVTMADAYARVSGGVGVVTVHQGCGFTNTMTGLTEAAKSRTPLVVLAAETTAPRSNFYVDQPGLAAAVGARWARTTTPDTAVAEAVGALRLARAERRTVVLNMPLEVQAAQTDCMDVPDEPAPQRLPDPDPAALDALADLVAASNRPVFVAGRGARTPAARDALVDLAANCGALLATSAVAKGLFHDQPWSLDVSGGFASPLAAELIAGADLVVGWGCSLNMWTMRHGRLIGPDAMVAQVDLESDAIGANRPVNLGVVGDVAAVAGATRSILRERGHVAEGYRTHLVAERLRAELRWRDLDYDDESGNGLVDPRTLTIGLDDILPAERIIGIDSGNFMGWPAMFLSVPDENGMCFTQAFQSIGLGLATTIGAALARPDRLPVAALGDGGGLMSIAELDTVVRLGLPMVVVFYNDAAYGAEVHHFGPDGHPLGSVTFPETDIAAIGRGFGCDAVTVREPGDVGGLLAWLAGPRDRPLVVDAKITSAHGSWWLEEAFRGH